MRSSRIISLFFIILTVLVSIDAASAAGPAKTEMRVMTYNIRLDDPRDSLIQCGWEQRRARLAGLIAYHGADIIGIQEGLINQLQYLDSVLPGFARIGVGRDDGAEGGEFCAIYYRMDKYEIMSSGTFWLSESPSKAGVKGWDAACNRVVTWGRFRDKTTSKDFMVFNTHFDHIGEEARLESAKLILDKIDEIAQSAPVILTGDFNCTPDSEPYKIIASALKDSHTEPGAAHYGPGGSSSGFLVCSDKELKRIDYIFVTQEIGVQTYSALTDSENQRYHSDHLPVICDIIIN